MKLLLENWRQYLNEAEEFDIDTVVSDAMAHISRRAAHMPWESLHIVLLRAGDTVFRSLYERGKGIEYARKIQKRVHDFAMELYEMYADDSETVMELMTMAMNDNFTQAEYRLNPTRIISKLWHNF